jgi:hypothetical protein
LRFVLNELFGSEAFWAEKNRGLLIKSPVDLVVGTLRTFGLRSVDGRPVYLALRQLGQDVFSPPNVKGWPGGEAWINTNTLLARKQFLARLLRSDEGEGMEEMRPQRDAAGAMRLRLQRALDAVHLDVDNWLVRVRAARLTPAQLLLAVPASDKRTDDGTSREALRELMLDASYQVR